MATEIIVNKSVPDHNCSMADVRAIFTMKKRVWPNGKVIKVYTLPDSHPLHKSFVKNVLQLFPHQLRRVWDRMIYSGTGAVPIEVDSEQEMIRKISANPYAIGYLDVDPHDANVYVLNHH